MERSSSHKLTLPDLHKRHGSFGPGHVSEWKAGSSETRVLTEQLLGVQRNYESISTMMQIKQEELRKALELVEREKQRSTSLLSEIQLLKQGKEAAASALGRANVLESSNKDLQHKLEQVHEEKKGQQKELVEARRELKRLAACLDGQRSMRESLAEEQRVLNADLCGSKRKIQELSKERDQLHLDLNDATDRLSTEQQMRAKMVQQQSDMHEHNAQLHLLAQQHFSKAAAAIEEVSRLDAKLSESSSSLQAVEAQLGAAKQRISTLEEQLSTKTAAWDQQRSEVKYLRSELVKQEQLEADLTRRFDEASQGQKDLQSELLAVSTKLSKVSAEASSAGSASEAAAHARNILCAKLAECQQTVQAQREAGQRLQETQAATEKILRHDMQRCMAERSQQRCDWKCTLHKYQRTIEQMEKQTFRLLRMQQDHQADQMQQACALVAEIEQQLACWLDTVQHIEASQETVVSKACTMAALHVSEQSQANKMRETWVNQVSTLQQQLQSTQQRLVDAAASQGTAVDDMANRFAAQMEETHTEMSNRVAALQEEVDALNETVAASNRVGEERLRTERAQQCKANEEIRLLMQEKIDSANHELAQARGHLIVLSKQHQAALSRRDAQIKELQNAMDEAANHTSRTLDSVVKEGCMAVSEVSDILGRVGTVLSQATVPGVGDCISETAPPLIQHSEGHSKDLIVGILALKTHATILHKDCGLKIRALIDASKKSGKQLLLPDFNDQERTLRNTIEKLVQVEHSLETNYTCLSCLSIFNDPVVCVPCGHCVCRSCASGASCPECQASLQQLVPARNLARVSAKFEFKRQALSQLQTMAEGKIVEAC